MLKNDYEHAFQRTDCKAILGASKRAFLSDMSCLQERPSLQSDDKR